MGDITVTTKSVEDQFSSVSRAMTGRQSAWGSTGNGGVARRAVGGVTRFVISMVIQWRWTRSPTRTRSSRGWHAFDEGDWLQRDRSGWPCRQRGCDFRSVLFKAGTSTREAYERKLTSWAHRIADCLDGVRSERERRARGILSLMMGAITISRAVSDPTAQTEVVTSARSTAARLVTPPK